MKVFFLPDYSQGNPYQRCLANSLSKQGVKVRFGTTTRLFSLLFLILKQGRPDILHLHWLHPFLLGSSKIKTIIKGVTFLTELLILKLLGIKIVWTVHNIVNHEEKFANIELFFNRLVARICDRIIVHSQRAKYEVKKAYGINKDSQLTIIPHGNYIGSYENTINKLEARKQLHINPNVFVFLYFGSIRSYKGIPELIDAYKKLNASNTRLLITGKPINDEIAKDLLDRCNGNSNIICTFKFIPDDEIQIYMNSADIVVLPYRDILTSGAVILAMSFGKPVIVPSIGCISDVLDTGGSILYNPLEKEGLLKAMKQALGANLKKMGKHNFELAKQFRWDDIAKRTREVYQECLRGKR